MMNSVKLYIAAVGGALILIVADLITNIDAATTLKIGTILETFILQKSLPLGPGVLGIAVVALISVFLCWIYQPKDKVAAFTRGISVFAVLTAATPYSIVNNSEGFEQQSISESSGQDAGTALSFVTAAYARGTNELVCREGVLEPDAILIDKKRVSACKPHYSGVLGVGSFLNNTIEFCNSNHTLEKGERVRYLKSWSTALRDYRYSEIEFEKDGKVCRGWVSDGRKSVRHVIRQ